LTWRVAVTPSALEMIRAIPDRRVRDLVADAISGLSEDPDKKGKPLIGELAGYRSLRAAGQRYRVIYTIIKTKIVVVVVAIGKRKEEDRKDVYALARKLIRHRLLDQG